MSMAQSFAPHPTALGQHPGGPQGHPMSQGHPSSQGQAGGAQAISQQMHPGVSAAGAPQSSQGGPAMSGLPPGAGGPAQSAPGNGGPSAHALSHLNPAGQAQMFQQQQQQQQQQLMQQTCKSKPLPISYTICLFMMHPSLEAESVRRVSLPGNWFACRSTDRDSIASCSATHNFLFVPSL